LRAIALDVVGAISPERLAQALRSGDASLLLLDVREPFERQLAVIEPSAHIPMNDIPDRKGELPTGRQIVVYCHHGTRSEMVAGYLEGEGFRDILNLTGGIDAWSTKVDSAVPRYD